MVGHAKNATLSILLVEHAMQIRRKGGSRPPAPSLSFGNSGSASCCPGAHYPHDALASGSGFGAALRSEFTLQRQPSVRQAALEHLPTPMPFTTGSFRARASSSWAAYNGRH